MLSEISIVIPVAANDESWKRLLPSLGRALEKCEIWIVSPKAVSLSPEYQKGNIKVLEAGGGRAAQLNVGARAATRKYLWFLHADTILKDKNLLALERALNKNPSSLNYFELYFQNDGPSLMQGLMPSLMWINTIGVWFRCRLFHLPFGDQAFCLPRDIFFELGGFNETAQFGEDHLLVWAAHHQKIKVQSTGSFISTSARKYAERGWLSTTGLHLKLTYAQARAEKVRASSPGAMAIFVKTPELSPVKTRLAEGIGKARALNVYDALTKQMEGLADHSAGSLHLESYWAVAELEGMSHKRWSHLKRISQGEGDLGKRLSNVYRQLLKIHSRVLLVGADCPSVDARILEQALSELARSPFVIGRANDGGFYLFGGRLPIAESLWCSIPYSAHNTAEELVQRLKPYGKVSELPVLSDIDTVTDLQQFQKAGLFTHINLQ